MSRVARLGAFIIVTLVVFAAGIFIIGSKEYLLVPRIKSMRSSTTWSVWLREPMCRSVECTAVPCATSYCRIIRAKRLRCPLILSDRHTDSQEGFRCFDRN